MELPFSAAEFTARLARVRAAMARHGVDVLLNDVIPTVMDINSI